MLSTWLIFSLINAIVAVTLIRLMDNGRKLLRWELDDLIGAGVILIVLGPIAWILGAIAAVVWAASSILTRIFTKIINKYDKPGEQ